MVAGRSVSCFERVAASSWGMHDWKWDVLKKTLNGSHSLKGISREFLTLQDTRCTAPEHREKIRSEASATASWTAVTKMQGARLHRRHRFRMVSRIRRPQHAVRPAKAASRPACRSHSTRLSRSREQQANVDFAKESPPNKKPARPCGLTGDEWDNQRTGVHLAAAPLTSASP